MPFQDFDLLTLKEVAALLHCSKAHICKVVLGRVVGCPAIPSVALGRRRLIRRESLAAWIQANEKALDATMQASPLRGAGKRA
jgi:excisionase family DNA binding protein